MSDEALARGRAAYPDLALPAEAFSAHLARHGVTAALAGVDVEGLYLACACARGVPGALERFDKDLLGRVPGFLAQLRLAPQVVDEVRQELRATLLLPGPDGERRIATFSGAGALANWLRVSAVRAALRHLRARPDAPGPGPSLLEALPAEADPELEFVRRRYHEAFQGALRETLATLTPKQRTLLSLYFFSKLSTHDLAEYYQVNQATVSRWLAAARAVVHDGTRERLREQLRLSGSEFDDLSRLLRSRLDLSLSVLLTP